MSKCVCGRTELHWHIQKCQKHNSWPCFNCSSIKEPPKEIQFMGHNYVKKGKINA